jgi:hypothetical protein
MCWIHSALAVLFRGEREFESAHTHIEQAKLHAVNDPYNLGRAMETQAQIWYTQGRFKEAKSEALRALETYEKIGAVKDLECCRADLKTIERAMENQPSSDNSSSNGKPLKWTFLPTPANSLHSARNVIQRLRLKPLFPPFRKTSIFLFVSGVGAFNQVTGHA